MADAVSVKSVDLVQLPTRSESVVPFHSAGFVTSQACEERTHQRARMCSSSDLSVSPGRRTGQFYVPDHQERIKEFRERCLVSRAKSATLPTEEMDRAPRVPLHISRVPELITVKEVRLGEDACCTEGLSDPAHLLDRWPSLRECWRPIRHGILRARARLPDCVGLTRTCGERPWRPPP